MFIKGIFTACIHHKAFVEIFFKVRIKKIGWLHKRKILDVSLFSVDIQKGETLKMNSTTMAKRLRLRTITK